MMKNKSTPPQKIKFVGKDAPAPEFLTDGNTLIELPKDQSKPFSHSQAKRILAVAPELYKKVISRRRSAESGKFVSVQFAEDNPSTTVKETV